MKGNKAAVVKGAPIASRAGSVNEKRAEPTGGISQELDALSQAIGGLEDEASALCGRISPIMFDSGEGSANNGEEPEPTRGSGVARVVQALRQRLSNTTLLLNNARNRIDL